MAEGYFRRLAAAEIGAGSIRVTSAGVAADEGAPPVPQVIEYMRGEGIDVSAYRSRPADQAFIEENDLLLTMTLHNSQRLLTVSDEAVFKAFTLKELVTGAERNGGPPAPADPRGRLEAMKRQVRRVEGLDGEEGGSLEAPLKSFFLHYFHLYGQDLSIDDPLGKSRDFLERCAAEIRDYTERFYRLLR